MGTVIDLTVEGITIDWSKNHMGSDHGALFQPSDLYRRKAEQKRFRFFRERDDYGKDAAGFVRTLERTLPRLDLMGHTLENARLEYEAVTKEASGISKMIGGHRTRFMSFKEFCDFVSSVPLLSLSDKPHHYQDRGKAKGRLTSLGQKFNRIPDRDPQEFYWSERSYFGSKVCVLSAYSMLQVFGVSPANHKAEVAWQFGPLVYAGWAEASSFAPGVRRRDTILIVTEGSSDSRILKHAIELLRPDVADFFRFVDVDESHPFWGTGNLVKFAQGLIRIDVQNLVLFVLDNDAEGADALRRLNELGMPSNMRAMTLPKLPHFQSFPTLGPQGLTQSDINGQAAGIEAYLDLNLPNMPSAQVIWSNFKREVGAWQGALEHKESYMRFFLSQTGESVASTNYNLAKLEPVLVSILRAATFLSSGKLP
jgi:HEPN superfamily Toprim-like protein